jgi:hypothetical protein
MIFPRNLQGMHVHHNRVVSQMMSLAGMGASILSIVALTKGEELLRLEQGAMVVLINDQIVFVRAHRAVRITTSSTWEAVAQALIDGMRVHRVRLLAGEESDSSSTVEQLVGALHNIGALEAPPRETTLSAATLERHRRTLRFCSSTLRRTGAG